MTNCPACAAPATTNPSGFITYCKACSHRWHEFDKIIYEQIVENHYPTDYAGYVEDNKFVRSARKLIEKQIAPRVPAPARLLDVGCGGGDFLRAAKDAGYQVMGIDASKASPPLCAKKGVDAIAENFLTYDFGQKFDVITMIDVIEHLDHPRDFLDRVHDLLTPTGLFLSKTPIFGDLSVDISNRVPKAAGLLLGAPGHCQYFNRASMATMMDAKFARHELLPKIEGGMRAAKTGGGLKRKIGRKVRHRLKAASGDENIYIAAYK